MRLASISGRAAIVSPAGRYLDVERATAGAVSSDPMDALEVLEQLHSLTVPDDAPLLDGLPLGAPVPRPGKILGAGINYFEHAAEAGFDLPDQPLLFAKLPSAICGPADEIVLPAGRDSIDWEAELVIVIGRRARNIPVGDAWTYVAGLTAGQDISDREGQFRSLRQFTMGKSFDTFAPLGPMLVTPDEFADHDDIQIKCWIDDEQVQSGRTSDCIFSVAELISWVSQICTLETGDLIFTGTPPGVGYIQTPPRFLRPGQVLRTEIESIGALVNRCVAGPPYVVPRYEQVEPEARTPLASEPEPV